MVNRMKKGIYEKKKKNTWRWILSKCYSSAGNALEKKDRSNLLCKFIKL